MIETTTSLSIPLRPLRHVASEHTALTKKVAGKVPVFNVTLGDKDLGLLSGPEFTGVDLEKVQKLLEDKIYSTRQLQTFHEVALRKVAKTYNNGFLLRNCAVLGRIFSICATRLSDQPSLVPIIAELVQICSLGLITQGTSHEAAFEKQAIYLVDEISQLVLCSSDEVRQSACHCFLKLFAARQKTETYQGTQRCSLMYNRFIIEQSNAAVRFLLAMRSFDLTDSTELLVIKLLQKLTKQSGVICTKLLEHGAASMLVRRLTHWPFDSEPVFRTVEIIWNLHDITLNSSFRDSSPNALMMFVDQLSDTDSLRPLHALFVYHLHRPHAATSRQLRNDAIVLASLVAKYKPAAAFLETGFAQLMLNLATTNELGGKSILAVANNREDFELKKLFINIVALLSRDVHTRNLLSSNGVIPAFSVYVCAGAPPGKREWSEAQREEIQLHAIAALAELVPLLPADVIECRLPTRMLLMLDWSADQSTAYEGSGNSFYGAGGYKSKRAQLRYCARLLLASVADTGSSGTAAVIDNLVEQGAIEALLRVIRSVLEQQAAADAKDAISSGSNEEAIAVEIEADLLVTLSMICSSGNPSQSAHHKELFGTEGCNLLCQLLRSTPLRLASGLGHARLLLACLDCLWSAGIGSDLTEDALLENGTIFALLDLVQMMHDGLPTSNENKNENSNALGGATATRDASTAALAEVAMGCLVDLMDNPRSIRHLLAWRGNRGVTAPHLFCEMWRRQRGIRSEQLEDDIEQESPESVLCSRIYAIFLRLGWSDIPGLTAEDHITRPEIDHYLDDLTCYTWRSVAADLGSECLIEPTEEDARMLQLIGLIAKEKATLVVAEQGDAIQASEQSLLTDEAQYYEQISANQQLRQRSFDRYADLVARTSRHNALAMAKQRQLLAVDASRVRDPKTIRNYHGTGDIVNIGTTVYSGREVAVDSEPCEITGGRLAVYNALQQQQQQQRMQQELQVTQQQTPSVATAPLLTGNAAAHTFANVNPETKSIGGSTMSLPVLPHGTTTNRRLQQAQNFASNAKKALAPGRLDRGALLEEPQ